MVRRLSGDASAFLISLVDFLVSVIFLRSPRRCRGRSADSPADVPSARSACRRPTPLTPAAESCSSSVSPWPGLSSAANGRRRYCWACYSPVLGGRSGPARLGSAREPVLARLHDQRHGTFVGRPVISVNSSVARSARSRRGCRRLRQLVDQVRCPGLRGRAGPATSSTRFPRDLHRQQRAPWHGRAAR